MIMKLENVTGATPLEPDELAEIIPTHIRTQGQLNEWEAENILSAENWLFSTMIQENFLTIDFTKLLHKKMFDNTWRWAGKFRTTEKNIGVAPFKITSDLKTMLEDIRYQIINESFPIDEIAYRFHHRLVLIHPFPNGNGRHARLFTDFLLTQAGQPRFTWGLQKLETIGPVRKRYIDALKKADKRNYTALAKFVRS